MLYSQLCIGVVQRFGKRSTRRIRRTSSISEKLKNETMFQQVETLMQELDSTGRRTEDRRAGSGVQDPNRESPRPRPCEAIMRRIVVPYEVPTFDGGVGGGSGAHRGPLGRNASTPVVSTFSTRYATQDARAGVHVDVDPVVTCVPPTLVGHGSLAVGASRAHERRQVRV